MYHKEDYSYFNYDSMLIPTGVISPQIYSIVLIWIIHIQTKSAVSFPQFHLHVVTELDENFSEIENIIKITGFGVLVFFFVSQNTMMIALALLNISTFNRESLGMI